MTLFRSVRKAIEDAAGERLRELRALAEAGPVPGESETP